VCDGVSPECPPDEIESAGAVCRPAVDLCDFEEACDGVGSACPPDLGLPDGTPCGGDDVCFTAECVAARCEVASRNPDDPNAPPPADFVFLIDTSRSMRRHLGIWLPEHLCAFPGLLEEAGIVDYRLAVVRFGTNRDPTVSGGKFPEVLLPCTDDPLRFCETITALQNDIQARTESGTEAMQFALSDPNTLGCRKAAFRNVILYTDEDDDSPATSGERKSPPGRGIRCYGRFCGKRWPAFQQRIDDAAALLIEQRAHLHMVESPRDAPTKSQYGDPTCTVTRPDGSQDPSAMLECLLRPTRFGNVSPVGICDGGLCTQGRRGEPCGSDSDCNAYSLQIHLLASGQCAGGVCTGGHVGFPCSQDADCALPAQAYRVPRGVNAAETLFREQLFPDIIRQQVCPAP
jgi:hypothetical protein